MEIGHIFQLGRKYAEALDLKVLDENGKRVIVTMGSYGIGVSRAVAAIAEAGHDELGLVWPRDGGACRRPHRRRRQGRPRRGGGEALAADLVAAGLDVLLRRPAAGSAPGVKFKDAELIGVPTIVTVGKRLAEGVVEVRDRAGDQRTTCRGGAATRTWSRRARRVAPLGLEA